MFETDRMLETARLRLRHFSLDDFDAVHAYASDPVVTRYTAFGPNSESETREFLARATAESVNTPRRNYTLAIVHAPSQKLIGGCSVDLVDPIGQQYHLGYVLHPGYWRQGFGTEAVRRLVAFGFGELNAWRIHAFVFAGNDASARLLQRLGFRLEGTLRQSFFVRNVRHDQMLFALLRSEWRDERLGQ